MGLFGSRKNSDDNRNFHIFEEAQQQAGENVQLVLRKATCTPSTFPQTSSACWALSLPAW